MNRVRSKMRMTDQLKFSDGKLVLGSHDSGRMIGKVTIDEYDAFGRKIFTSTETNDITLPGSIFVLEQMFKTKAGKNRFLHTTAFPKAYNSNETMTKDFNKDDVGDKLNEEFVFGFMVGNGGESGSGVVAPKYDSTYLRKETDTIGDNSNISFLPFRIILDSDDNFVNETDHTKYTLPVVSEGKTYYFAKKFEDDIQIYSKWADGSGDVSESELGYSTPILSYAEAKLKINASDLRDFFGEGNIDSCAINQLGLVAGLKKSTNEKGIDEFDDVKLVTCVNFKARDLSNTENMLQITYKIYCI